MKWQLTSINIEIVFICNSSIYLYSLISTHDYSVVIHVVLKLCDFILLNIYII